MKKSIILILFFFPLFLSGQYIDSLKTQFNNAFSEQDTNIYTLSKEISNYYKYRFPDTALNYYDFAIEYAKKNEHKNKYLEFKILKAELLSLSYQYYMALENYNSVIKIISGDIQSIKYSTILYEIANIQIKAGFSSEISQKYLEQSIEISKRNKNIKTEAISYALMSKLFSKESNFDSAFYYINKSIELLKNNKDKTLSATIFYYYSSIFYHKKEYIKAATYIKKSISLVKNKPIEAFYLTCLGGLYMKMGHYDAAKNIFNKAEKRFTTSENNVMLAKLYLSLSDLAFEQRKNDIAIKYSQRALKLSKYLNIQKIQQDAYQRLSKIYNANQQIDLALVSFQKYSKIRDSLFSQKTKNEGQLLYQNYLMQLKLRDNQLLFKQKQYQELKNKQQKLAIYILAFFGVLLTAILFILSYFYRLKKSNEERLKQITEASLEGVIIHDGEKILDLNDKFCEISGFGRNEIIGKPFCNILPEKSKLLVKHKFNLRKTTFYQMDFLRTNHSTFEAEVLSKPIIYKNNKAKVVSIRDLSEIRKVQEKLFATKKQFEVMIETSPDGVLITDNSGKIKYVSPAFVKLFNYDDAESFINKNLSDFVTDLYKNKVSTDLENILKENFRGVSEYVAIKKDKNEFYLECNGTKLKNSNESSNGIFMIVRDITERKIVENALLESESRFKGLFNNSKDTIIVQDDKYQIIDANPAASKMLNYSYPELLSKDFRKLLDKNYQNIKYSDFANEDKAFETYLFTKNRKKLYIQVSISLIPYQSKNFYMLSIKDLTPFKRQEERLKRVAKKLSESNTMKDKMFSIISHDLRGPIGNLKTMIEYISENPEDFDTKEIIEIIQSLRTSSSQTYQLLENLLNWAKSQQNILEYNPDIFNLNNTIDTALNIVQESALQKKIIIEKNLDNNLYVLADENMISTVLRNLISNAIKFTNINGKIFVEAKDDGDFIIVVIKDNGVGISDDNLMKIFDQNTFVTTYGTNHEKGTGLGLKLCHEFITKNNGKIWVNSKKNNGTTFFFTIKKA